LWSTGKQRLDGRGRGARRKPEESRGASVYTITVSQLHKGEDTQAVYDVQEYEVKEGVLTLAFDNNHDVVIPLFQVSIVDIQRR
jgi:hypothetical protein